MSFNIALLKESFEAIKPHAQDVIEHFYDELFSKYPESKNLFNQANMNNQQRALINSLAHIVEFIEDNDHLTDYLRKMGARHIQYGTRDQHFVWVADALLSTFSFYFDDQWTEELKETWTIAFAYIETEMKVGIERELNKKNESQGDRAVAQASAETSESNTKEHLMKSIEQELESDFIRNFIREKAKEALKQAIENEVKQSRSA